MAKRKLSQRQKERIRLIQDRRRQRVALRADKALESVGEQTSREGEIIARYGANIAVQDTQGKIHHCLARQNIGEPVCGDRVVWQPTEPGNGVVTALLNRQTLLSRPDYSGREKPLAANISQLVIVIAPEPEPSEYLVDQYLVAAELINVQAVIALNKSDLLDKELLAEMDGRFSKYDKIGYPYLHVSAKENHGLDSLIERLQSQTSILVGQSGVGKSSLINALLPDKDVQIGQISKATGFGRHTTSVTTSYRLPSGGKLIDSPGVRSFRLGEITQAQLEQGFVEFRPLLGKCRFSNCAHADEPDCALTSALARGDINPPTV